ncbi:MAG TPA: enoyl-CoA hydratase [Candidatus Binataceae bacterium]|jgi:2-(1,2-epoxy-1,2-dihydrophenyl)acetyl-CoA isomerase
MSTEHRDLIAERRDGVLYLTMNRPDKLNALSDQMIAGLLEELGRAAHDREVGAVVLTGAGRGFCAGGDIGRMRDRNEAGGAAAASSANSSAGEQGIQTRISSLRRSEEVSLLLHEMPKVTIGAINGPAAGAGLSIALACDLRIASDAARFGTAFARVGFSGDFGGTYLLTQLVGTAKARELYFTAEVLGAEEALKLGMVNRVVPAASLTEEVNAFAKRIAAGPVVAYSYMKAHLNLALKSDLRTILDRESYGQTLTGLTEDHKEAVKAFLEKREAKFQGR